MKNRKILLRMLSLCMALALSCNLFPLHNVRADELTPEEQEEQEQNGGAAGEGEMVRETIEINTPEDFLAFAGNCSLDSWSSNKRVILNEDIDLSGAAFESVPVFCGVFDGQNHTISGFQYSGDGYVAGLFRYIEKGGCVENLTVKGEVTAAEDQECIGGLCGVNYGTIRKCSFQGNVRGNTTVGGLAGVNEGTGVILDSAAGGRVTGYYSTGGLVGRNHGTVNHCVNRACVNNDREWVEEADEMGMGIFLRVNVSDSDTKLFSGVDCGGIAGCSDGVIIRCANYGVIGYEHTGYNIGGIAGRQSGVVSLCTNDGTVYGRKDVGGIVGQMEPYIDVDEAESLRNAVNKLHDLIEKTIDDMGDGKNAVKNDLDALTGYGDRAVDAGDALAEQMADFVDANMDQAQAMADRMDHMAGMLTGVFDNIDAAEDSFSDANRVLGRIGDRLGEMGEDPGSPDGKSGPDGGGLNEEWQRVNDLVREIQDAPDVSAEQIMELQQALPELSESVSGVMDSLDTGSAGDSLQGVGDDLTEAMDCLQQAMDFLKAATREARSIVDYANGQEDIRFSKLGGSFDTNRENLHAQLKGMSGCIQSLSDNASSYSDVVNEDLKAVNDQMNIVFNLLADHLTNYEEISVEELYEDVDMEDTDSITEGKVDNCLNRGIVQGDINVGGIAGAMSVDEEDFEDGAAGSVEYQVGRKYFTKCLITDCVNEGYVTAKKDGVGGIAGYMRHGIVVDSEGYGSVESTEGNYVGGICGESFTVIRRCYALCYVSGGKNVGGIAGFADTLKDCYAIADCHGEGGRIGAIAGQTVPYDDALTEEEVKVSGNYYVGGGIGGIDNISYAGAAEPISYKEMLGLENVPVQFRHLKVIYRVDDRYLGTQEVPFGESLSGLEYPDIPEKEGYYGVWPDHSGEVMKCNLLIDGEYREDVTVVQSNGAQVRKDGEETWPGRERPYALVEQRFTEDTVMKVDLSDAAPPEQARSREYVIYDVVLEQAEIRDTDAFAIRLYNPYGQAAVWGCKDGVWTELESKMRGGYLQVDMTGPEEMFCVAEQPSGMGAIAAYTAGGAAVAALLFLAAKKLRARHRVKRH